MPYLYTISYIIFIVLVNALFSFVPPVTLFNNVISPIDILVGAVYVLRDLAQREIKHYVLIAMLIATGLSYLLSDKTIAIASATAFLAGELIDWGIYSFTRQPLSERILWSSLISCPIDSIIFLHMANSLNMLGFIVLVGAKFIGVFALWYYWQMRYPRQRELLLD